MDNIPIQREPRAPLRAPPFQPSPFQPSSFQHRLHSNEPSEDSHDTETGMQRVEPKLPHVDLFCSLTDDWAILETMFLLSTIGTGANLASDYIIAIKLLKQNYRLLFFLRCHFQTWET